MALEAVNVDLERQRVQLNVIASVVEGLEAALIRRELLRVRLLPRQQDAAADHGQDLAGAVVQGDERGGGLAGADLQSGRAVRPR